jgi:hypothetical protein
MKTVSTCLGTLVFLLLAVLLFQHRQARELRASFVALDQDRDRMNSHLRILREQVDELKKRNNAATAVGAASPGTAATASASSASETAPIVPLERPGVTITAPWMGQEWGEARVVCRRGGLK